MAGTIDDKYTTLGAFREATKDLSDDLVVLVNAVENLSFCKPELLNEVDIANWRKRNPGKPDWYKVGMLVPGDMLGYYEMLWDTYTSAVEDTDVSE